MRIIITISLITLLFIIFLSVKKARADRIEYFRYEACYAPVPIRAGPDPNATQTGEIPKGETVRVSKQKSYWVKVIYKDEDGNYTVGWSASTAMCPVKQILLLYTVSPINSHIQISYFICKKSPKTPKNPPNFSSFNLLLNHLIAAL